MKKLTKKQAVAYFKEYHLPFLDRTDKDAIRFEWSCYTDSLCKGGKITLKQYESWQYPSFCN